eukprot:1398716-Prymnesium_polylepis.2
MATFNLHTRRVHNLFECSGMNGENVAPSLPHPSDNFLNRRKSAAQAAAEQGHSPQELIKLKDSLHDELDLWRRCSGLHTIEGWVLNYQKHPAGWAALLMIHGVSEVTGRLRSKVENYAIYSALFLSFSVPAVMTPPEPLWVCEDGDQKCLASKYAFMSALSFAVAAHMLSIMIGMSFVNALNEAPRDSDVYRMFARGQGFLATVKCQKAFRYGMLANFLAMAVAGQLYIGWASLLCFAVLLAGAYQIFQPTTRMLFSNGSIVDYWRTELGGKPDADDPFELETACKLFKVHAQSMPLRLEPPWPRAD